MVCDGKVGLGAHLVQTKSRVCGEMKHLDRVGDHITHRRVHHRTCRTDLIAEDSLGTYLVGLIVMKVSAGPVVHTLERPVHRVCWVNQALGKGR
jgi:hypothetical protein